MLAYAGVFVTLGVFCAATFGDDPPPSIPADGEREYCWPAEGPERLCHTAKCNPPPTTEEEPCWDFQGCSGYHKNILLPNGDLVTIVRAVCVYTACE